MLYIYIQANAPGADDDGLISIWDLDMPFSLFLSLSLSPYFSTISEHCDLTSVHISREHSLSRACRAQGYTTKLFCFRCMKDLCAVIVSAAIELSAIAYDLGWRAEWKAEESQEVY